MLIFPAAMTALSTVMLSLMMSMMAAAGFRIKGKVPGEKSLYRFICTAGYAAVQPNPRLCQRHLCSGANSATD